MKCRAKKRAGAAVSPALSTQAKSTQVRLLTPNESVHSVLGHLHDHVG
jgi:hypothetical protein